MFKFFGWLWQTFFPAREPLINGGTSVERLTLANLIERGTTWHGIKEAPSIYFQSLELAADKTISATVIGFAILGLGGVPAALCKAYAHKLRQFRGGRIYMQYPTGSDLCFPRDDFNEIHAAAIMIGLPYELLLETQQYADFGAGIQTIIEDLRLPVRQAPGPQLVASGLAS